MIGFRSIEGVEVTALCDLHEGLLREQADKFGIPNTYRIYEDMLDSDIDAVVISTPMQLHVQQTIQALEAGKHVMCEVTAGVTMDELWWLKEAVEKHSDKVFMFAENYCYIPTNQLIGSMVKKGLFGDIYFGEGEYLHDIKHLASGYNRRVPGAQMAPGKTSWRNYWQLGKRGAFYPTHSLGPLMQWFKGERIQSIATFATGWHTAPGFRQEDTSLTMVQLESGKLLKIRLDCISNRPHNGSYYSLQGTKACYEAPRGLGDDHKIYFVQDGEHPDKAQWRPLSDFNDLLPERYRNVTEEQSKAGHWGGDYFIVQDFVDSIRNGTKPPIDVYDACEWTAVGLLSELSVTNGGRVMEMPDFRGKSSYKEQIIKL
ncbi:gfo/Idh/MocA family oxidoreductase [Paenibacillus ginsengarvi]|uniref:Gfo/Idh/MocA family oxidoreductase n=2 Tax=Paenibacillus ginsengarvi TaxID=400777 RepID=A0A3B0C883_9BACL|nr:gfo/Idh/MocA family oxidoreductase [Paenibacillus ginsengarvi]